MIVNFRHRHRQRYMSLLIEIIVKESINFPLNANTRPTWRFVRGDSTAKHGKICLVTNISVFAENRGRQVQPHVRELPL